MKHLFVPYELALQLKEKGFDEPCFAYYGNFTGIEYIPYEEYPCSNSSDLMKNRFTAPLYQQVTDWFYNEHRLFVEADGYIIDSGEYDGCYAFKATVRGNQNYKDHIIFAQGEFPTRQKAWDTAIEEALKLI